MELYMDWDWMKVKQARSLEELKKTKLWLFRENIRVQNEKQELDMMKDKFFQEKTRYQKEMDALNQRITVEQKRIRDENTFFEKRMEMLQDGFRKLEADRNQLDSEKEQLLREREQIKKEIEQLEQEKKRLKQKYKTDKSYKGDIYVNPEDYVKLLFRNAETAVDLKKRYKDLMKIFHPDNNGGDEEMVQLINKEFNRRKEE